MFEGVREHHLKECKQVSEKRVGWYGSATCIYTGKVVTEVRERERDTQHTQDGGKTSIISGQSHQQLTSLQEALESGLYDCKFSYLSESSPHPSH